jgi:hypothetical protein
MIAPSRELICFPNGRSRKSLAFEATSVRRTRAQKAEAL